MHLLELKSNSRLLMNKETRQVEPEIELVFLCAISEYTLDGDTLKTDAAIVEHRMFISGIGLANLCGRVADIMADMERLEDICADMNAPKPEPDFFGGEPVPQFHHDELRQE